MLVNPKILKSRFEKSLDKYNDNAVVQKQMAINLLKKLAVINCEFSNILELGCGSGLLTEIAVSKLKFNRYYANDLTQDAYKYVKNIFPKIKFYSGNALKIKPETKFDLIISNAMFQWLNLNTASDKFGNMLNKEGILAFTTFTKGNYSEIADLTGLSLDYKTSDEINKIFLNRYELLYKSEYEKTIEFDNPLKLLLHMKNTGVNSLSDTNWTIKDVKDFNDKCLTLFPNPHLTYKPAIFIYRKV